MLVKDAANVEANGEHDWKRGCRMEDSRQDPRTEHGARRTRKSKCKMQMSKCKVSRSGICHENLRAEHSTRGTRKSTCKMQMSKCRMPRSEVCHEDRCKEETIFAKTRMLWPCSTERRRSHRRKDGRWRNEDRGRRMQSARRRVWPVCRAPLGAGRPDLALHQ
jgi:hypothetical protein